MGINYQQQEEKKYKIGLINPGKGYYPRLGLGYLASYLLKYCSLHCDIKIFDASYDSNIVQNILKFKPNIIGVTALSSEIFEAFGISKKIYSFDKSILQVIGGVHVTALPEQTLRNGNFAIAVLGEGEETFLEIVEHYFQMGSPRNNLCKIKGIGYIEDNQYIETGVRPTINHLDKIPFPARDLLNMKFYNSYYHLTRAVPGSKLATISSSRGCPYNCTFCSSKIVFKKVRRFSPEYTVSEIKELIEKYKVKRLFFLDDTFIVDKNHIKNFCNLMIEKNLNIRIRWEVLGRSNLIKFEDLELLLLMKEAGCEAIDYGFESGCPRVLKFLKGETINIEDHQRAIEVTRKAGLKVFGTFMIGTPDEREEELEETVRFIERNLNKIDRFDTFITEPFPGSKLWEKCVEKNIVHSDYLYQHEKERGQKLLVYTDTIESSKIYETLKYLDRLAFRKIKLINKIFWIFYNLTHHFTKSIASIRNFIRPTTITGRQ